MSKGKRYVENAVCQAGQFFCNVLWFPGGFFDRVHGILSRGSLNWLSGQWSTLEILPPVDLGGTLATLIDDSETARTNGVRSSNKLLLKFSLATLAGYSHTWCRLPL